MLHLCFFFPSCLENQSADPTLQEVGGERGAPSYQGTCCPLKVKPATWLYLNGLVKMLLCWLEISESSIASLHCILNPLFIFLLPIDAAAKFSSLLNFPKFYLADGPTFAYCTMADCLFYIFHILSLISLPIISEFARIKQLVRFYRNNL